MEILKNTKKIFKLPSKTPGQILK